MDIIYGLVISVAFIAVSVWLALKLWDFYERDLRSRMHQDPDEKQRLRRGVRDYTDSRGDPGPDSAGWGDGGGGFGGGGDGGGGA